MPTEICQVFLKLMSTSMRAEPAGPADIFNGMKCTQGLPWWPSGSDSRASHCKWLGSVPAWGTKIQCSQKLTN